MVGVELKVRGTAHTCWSGEKQPRETTSACLGPGCCYATAESTSEVRVLASLFSVFFFSLTSECHECLFFILYL